MQHAHDARQDGILILDAVRLVDDDVAEVELQELGLLLRNSNRRRSGLHAFYVHPADTK